MGYALWPLAALLFLLGIGSQLGQQSQNVPGAGPAGLADSLALASAQIAERYATTCQAIAGASPGLISSTIAVDPSIVNGATVAAPSGAGCMATSAGGGTRNLIAYMGAAPGEAGQVAKDTLASMAWYRVTSSGQGTSLATGLPSAVPATIAVGDLVSWIQVNP